MGDPGIGLNGAIGNQTDDTREIFRKGVSAGLEGDFSSMKSRVKKLNGLRGDPYINQRPRVCHIPQGIGHGVMIACGIDHQAIPGRW